jgi:pilus assembly protein CpaE
MEPFRAKVIALFSPKGGVGTTTLAVNLACALAARGRRVALVDGNVSFGNVGVILNLPHASNMLDLVNDPAGIDASIEEVLVPHPSGVRVLLAPHRPEEAEIVEGEHLQRMIAALRSRYEYVIVDTWASYDPRVLAVLEAADRVLIPTTPDLQAVKNLAVFLRVAELLKLSPKLRPGVNRVDSVSPAYLQEIEAFLAQPLTWRVVSDGKRVIQSVTDGVPFVLADPDAPISRDIARLARHVDGEAEEAPAPERRPFWKAARFHLSPAH